MKIDKSKTIASEIVKKMIDNNLKDTSEIIEHTFKVSYKNKDYTITSYMTFFCEEKNEKH